MRRVRDLRCEYPHMGNTHNAHMFVVIWLYHETFRVSSTHPLGIRALKGIKSPVKSPICRPCLGSEGVTLEAYGCGCKMLNICYLHIVSMLGVGMRKPEMLIGSRHLILFREIRNPYIKSKSQRLKWLHRSLTRMDSGMRVREVINDAPPHLAASTRSLL
jgi:hypothetical protein